MNQVSILADVSLVPSPPRIAMGGVVPPPEPESNCLVRASEEGLGQCSLLAYPIDMDFACHLGAGSPRSVEQVDR